MLRMMVHTCHGAEWKLENSQGGVVVNGATPADKECVDSNDIGNFYWEEACIDETQCYAFTVANTASTDTNQTNTGVEYLMLYDNDVPVASESGVLASTTGTAGTC